MVDQDYLKLELGDKLRRLREDRGRSSAQLAAASGIGETQLAAYEANREVPPIGELLRIASFLDVTIGHFFQTSVSERRVEVVRARDRWSVQPKTEAGLSLNYRYQALSHGLTEKLMEPFLVEVPPSGRSDLPRSSHAGEEFLFLLAGQLEVEVGGETHRLEPGDAIYFDSRLEHSLRAVEGSPARLLACVAQGVRPETDRPMDRAYL